MTHAHLGQCLLSTACFIHSFIHSLIYLILTEHLLGAGLGGRDTETWSLCSELSGTSL